MFGNYVRMLPPGTKNLLIINIIIWAFMTLAPAAKEAWVQSWCALHYMGGSGFNAAQLLTYFFLPVSFLPMFFNMLMLFFFGPQIEWAVGTRRFVFYYLSCGVGAGLVYEIVAILMMNHYMDMLPDQVSPFDPLLAKIAMLQSFSLRGADSAVFGIILAYGMLFAERTIQLLFPPIPIKAKYIALICIAVELIPVFQRPDMMWLNISSLAGMLVGFFIILYWKKKSA